MSSLKKSSSIDSSSGRGNEIRVIQEDGPEYRSVMMAPNSAPPLPRSFATTPPPLKFDSRPLNKSTPFKSSTHTSSAEKKAIWIVSEPTPLPFNYPLERTNVYVEDASAQECADRICHCLRILNIAAHQSEGDDTEPESSNSSSVLLAETHDFVKFSVRLFSDEGKIVVEVQRLGGCSFGFREASRAILRSTRGDSFQDTAPTRKLSIPPALPVRSLEVLESCTRDDFEIAMNMLQSECVDSQYLALDSLEQMTQSSELIQMAAKLVLESRCVERLVALLEDDAMVRKVLAVLANACTALESADLAEMLLSIEQLKAASFLSYLLSSLGEASDRPLEAYQAARCLTALLISKEVESTIVQMSCMDVVESAHSAGSNRHHALEQESLKLMTHLRNVCC
ncbi:hypothetical protein IV203_000482 [Nitzschia inconspicua]|uniref:Uncharacterized protein n=1 Tax=Nitzschia inconspicua TaxID=303405 RepID=A0A9K3PQQ6_9STRA|nr:hypothetical protein IV203_000482 [Nitzschia inconspicua]